MAAKFSVSVILKAIDQVTKPAKKMGDGIRKMIGPIKKVGAALKNIGSKWGAVFKKMGFSVGAVYGAMSALVLKTASFGDEITKTADRLGVSVPEFNSLRFAADRAGVSVTEFDTSFTMFSRNIGEAVKSGVGPAYDTFEQLQIHLMDGNGNLKTTADLFSEVADKIGGLPSESEKVSAAFDLMGRSGAKLVNLLNTGSEGIQEMKDRLIEIGGGYDEASGRKAEAMIDSIADIKWSFQGLRNSVVTTFFPTLTKGFSNLATNIGTNKDSIVKKIRTGIKIMNAVTTGFWEVMKGVFKSIRDLIGPLGDVDDATKEFTVNTEKLVAIGKILAKVFISIVAIKLGMFIYGLIAPFFQLAAAVGVFNAALWASPITWVIAGIIALIALIVGLSTNFLGIRDAALRMGDGIREGIMSLLNWIGGLAKAVWNIGSDIVGWIWQGIKDSWGGLTDWISGAWDSLLGVFGFGGGESPAGAGGSAGGGLASPGVGGAAGFKGNLRVDFANAPKGMRVAGYDQEGSADMGVETGLSLAPT